MYSSGHKKLFALTFFLTGTKNLTNNLKTTEPIGKSLRRCIRKDGSITWTIVIKKILIVKTCNHNLIGTLLTRENYQRIQEEIGFPETYEQHMSRLTHGIPNDASRMVKQIMVFINKYVRNSR